MKPKILVIVGPTASGKTSLALEVASLLTSCTIISVDARQAFKQLSILTGKDIPKKLPRGTKIYGTDLLDTNDETNIATFASKINPVIQESLNRGDQVILVGGSGLYLKAITSNLSDIYIPPDPVLREKLSPLSLEELQNKLKKLNESLFDKLNHSDQNNPRRLIRHIEKILSPKKTSGQPAPRADYYWVGLSLSKSTQKELIEKRVLNRIKSGAIQEVEKLRAEYPNSKLSLFTSLGVREISLFLDGKISKSELVSSWTNTENSYARRQVVWFKKQPSIIWYDESKDRKALAQEIVQALKNKK